MIVTGLKQSKKNSNQVFSLQLLLKKLKTFKAIGPDAVTNWVWKNCSDDLCRSIASIVSESMHVSEWPSLRKSKDVVSIMKSENPLNTTTDTRQIGHTCVVSKQGSKMLCVTIVCLC